jgi:hypothetical protein
MKILDIPQSGKAGQYVSYKGRNGLIRRGYVVPTNPRTAYQVNVRATLTGQAQRFRTLTEAQQDAWDNAGRRYQSRSRMGQSGPLTGFQLFTKLNAVLVMMGVDAIDTPPGPPNLGAVAPQNLVITNTVGVIALKLTCPTNPGQNTIVRASAPVSSAVRAVPQTRVLGTCPAPAQGSSDITSLYVARFGAPVEGDRVFVECNVFDPAAGWEGPRLTFTALVPAP